MTDNELEIMNTLRSDFNNRCSNDPNFFSQVHHFNRLLCFTVKDSGNTYSIRLLNGQALEVQQGTPVQRPDIRMNCSLKHLMGILTGEIPPAAAVMHPQIRILGSPADLAFVKKFILKESAHLRELAKTMNF